MRKKKIKKSAKRIFLLAKQLTKQRNCGIIHGYALGCRQAVRHGTLTPAFVGSNPAIPARKKYLRKQVLFSTKSAFGGRNPPAVDEIALR